MSKSSVIAAIAVLGLIVIAILVGSLLLSGFWTRLMASGVLLLLAGAILVEMLTAPRRKRRAGALLLDMGRPQTYRASLARAGLDAALGSGSLVLLLAWNTTKTPSDLLFLPYLSATVLCSISTIAHLQKALGHTEIRESGIWHQGSLIRWECVESCRWEGDVLAIVRKMGTSVAAPLHLPPAGREAVEGILARYL